MKDKFLTSVPLTDEQLAAVISQARRNIVTACPGSGKTRVLAARIEWELFESDYKNGTDPQKIVAITYTNSAAAEIKSRLNTPIGFVGTIHSYVLSLIRRFGPECLGVPDSITVIDEETFDGLINDRIRACHYKGSKRSLVASLDGGTGETEITGHVRKYMLEHGLFTYQNILAVGGQLLDVLDEEPLGEVLLVDEYQDVTEQIHEICMALNFERKFIVADRNQAIFGWAGADRSFCGRVAKCGYFVHHGLTKNFRAGEVICKEARRMIDAPMVSGVERDSKVDIWTGLPSDRHEYFVIWKELEKLPEDWTAAVLCRTNFIAEQIANCSRKNGLDVASKVWGDESALSRRNLIRFLSFLASPENDFLAYQTIKDQWGQLRADDLKAKAVLEFTSINRVFVNLPGAVEPCELDAYCKHFPSELLAELWQTRAALGETGTIADLIVALQSQETESVPGRIVVTTIHCSKGREWDWVFLPALNDNIIPGANARSPKLLEEERRLLYVGITRARHRVILSTANKRQSTKWEPAGGSAVQPSRFLVELMDR